LPQFRKREERQIRTDEELNCGLIVAEVARYVCLVEAFESPRQRQAA
jgi:hypothetical protein